MDTKQVVARFEAEPLYLATFDAKRRLLGDDNTSTLLSMNGLAALYFSQGITTEGTQ